MNEPPKKDHDAEFERNAAIVRERTKGDVARLRESLSAWIKENARPATDAAVSIALLETAFDRYIELHGAIDALELVESSFRQRAERFRRSLLLMGGANFTRVNLDRAIVAGDVTMHKVVCQGMISAQQLKVGGNLYMHDASFENVSLSGATIEGSLYMWDSIFNDVLDAFALHVGVNVGMGGATFNRVNLAYAVIGQNLDLRSATLASLDLTGATIAGDLQLGVTRWRTAKGEHGDLVMRNAKIGTLLNDARAWPDAEHLSLEGFSFAHLGGPGETYEPEAHDRRTPISSSRRPFRWPATRISPTTSATEAECANTKGRPVLTGCGRGFCCRLRDSGSIRLACFIGSQPFRWPARFIFGNARKACETRATVSFGVGARV
jgi:uncharacterized protein YjbI with pentapeptide repeats